MKHILALTAYIESATSHKWFTYLADGAPPLSTLDGTYTVPLGNFYPINGSTGLLSPAGNYYALLASNSNPYLSIYNFNTLESIDLSSVRPGYSNPIVTTPSGLAFSHDDRYLAVQHNYDDGAYLTVIDMENLNLETVPSVGGVSYQPKFNHNSTRLALAHGTSPYLTIIDTSDWSEVQGIPTGYSAYGADWSPDGSLLAVALQNTPYLKIYNTSNWSEVVGAPTPNTPSLKLCFSPDGTMLALSQISAGNLLVYNTSDWTLKYTLSGGQGVDFSADSSYIASGLNSSPYFRIYSTSTGVSQTTGITVSYQLKGVSYSRTPIATSITGTTKDQNDNGASFKVRLYNRNSGNFITEKTSSVDGNYTSTVIANDTLQRVVFSSTTSAPFLNDLIDRIEPL